MDGEAFLEARMAHYAEALASPPARAAASPVPILWTRPVISVNCRRRSGGGGGCGASPSPPPESSPPWVQRLRSPGASAAANPAHVACGGGLEVLVSPGPGRAVRGAGGATDRGRGAAIGEEELAVSPERYPAGFLRSDSDSSGEGEGEREVEAGAGAAEAAEAAGAAAAAAAAAHRRPQRAPPPLSLPYPYGGPRLRSGLMPNAGRPAAERVERAPLRAEPLTQRHPRRPAAPAWHAGGGHTRARAPAGPPDEDGIFSRPASVQAPGGDAADAAAEADAAAVPPPPPPQIGRVGGSLYLRALRRSVAAPARPSSAPPRATAAAAAAARPLLPWHLHAGRLAPRARALLPAREREPAAAAAQQRARLACLWAWRPHAARAAHAAHAAGAEAQQLREAAEALVRARLRAERACAAERAARRAAAGGRRAARLALAGERKVKNEHSY
jgi:hypothetical protein